MILGLPRAQRPCKPFVATLGVGPAGGPFPEPDSAVAGVRVPGLFSAPEATLESPDKPVDGPAGALVFDRAPPAVWPGPQGLVLDSP